MRNKMYRHGDVAYDFTYEEWLTLDIDIHELPDYCDDKAEGELEYQ